MRKLGPLNMLYPMPVVIVGTHVDNRPNFLTIAHVGIMNHGHPQYISISSGKVHYSNPGIHQHGTFSVNVPDEAMVERTDYVGLVSGKRTDKSAVFEVFYGELEAAPMISGCPLTMECKVYTVVDFPTHDVFIGEVVNSYARDDVFNDGQVDLAKVRPLLFDMSSKKYWKLGEPLADCWHVGKKLKIKLGGD